MYVGVSNLTKGMLMSDTKTVVVDPLTAPEIKKLFNGKIRLNFDQQKKLIEVVVLTPDEAASLVITAIANNIDAVFVPFESLNV
jgi:hypothetical protein